MSVFIMLSSSTGSKVLVPLRDECPLSLVFSMSSCYPLCIWLTGHLLPGSIPESSELSQKNALHNLHPCQSKLDSGTLQLTMVTHHSNLPWKIAVT